MPNVTLVLRWNDTRGDTVISTRAITEMICDGVATIFGPEGSCHVEAIVTQSRNIPMIAYVSCSFAGVIFKASLITHSPSLLRRNVPTTRPRRSQPSPGRSHPTLK